MSHLRVSEVRNPEANKEVWGQHVVSNGTKNTVNNLRKTKRLQHRLHFCMKLSDKNTCDEAGLPDHPVHNYKTVLNIMMNKLPVT
jgi:hypothetical protein